MAEKIDDWLEAQRINGGPHGFECIGIARMQQVWDAAQEDLILNVKLLREAASAELRGARSGRKELREALAATEPNLQQSRRFTDPVTDDDFLHMIDESNFAQERE